MTNTKIHKTNVTGYLATTVIDTLDDLAEAKNCSRNNLFEEAVLDYLEKKKEQIALLTKRKMI